MSKIVRYRNEKLFTVYQCRVDVPEVVGVHDYERRLIVPFGTFRAFPCLTTQKYLDWYSADVAALVNLNECLRLNNNTELVRDGDLQARVTKGCTAATIIIIPGEQL